MKTNNKVLLDTSAVIALINQEKGYQTISNVLATSSISAVNFSELIAVFARENITSDDIDTMTKNIIPEIIPFDHEVSIIAGKLISLTRDHGLSLGDRACIATAIRLDLPVYSADTIWGKLNIPQLKLHLIR